MESSHQVYTALSHSTCRMGVGVWQTLLETNMCWILISWRVTYRMVNETMTVSHSRTAPERCGWAQGAGRRHSDKETTIHKPTDSKIPEMC